jgi:hypothetical protein
MIWSEKIFIFMTPKNVLIVLSSNNQLVSTGRKTGWYLVIKHTSCLVNPLYSNESRPEFAHPYYVLSPHANLTIASPKGGYAPWNPGSAEAYKNDPQCTEFLQTNSALWENTEWISTFLGRAKEFDAIFYPGGRAYVLRF